MLLNNPAKILRVHFSESDRCEGAPLHEAIVQKCRELHIAGATVFRGVEGYGETGGIHRPVVIMVVDSAEKIAELTPAIESMVNSGMIAISDVDVVRVQRGTLP